MKKAKGKKKVGKQIKKTVAQRNIQNEVIGIGIVAFSLLMGLSLYTSQGGIMGKFFRKLLLGVFGISSYSVPLIVLVVCVAIVQRNMTYIHRYKALALLLFFDISALAHIISYGRALKSNFSFPMIDFSYYHGAQWPL